MHEASIAMSVLDTVIDQCRSLGYSRIETVRLRIGKAAGILTEALQFAFDIAKADTLAADAELIIESVPLAGQCRACGKSYEIEDRLELVCPGCRAPSLEITQGFELDVVDMEVN